MCLRLYDTERMHSLLRKTDGKHPEFHRPLELEYRVCHCQGFSLVSSVSTTAAQNDWHSKPDTIL